MILLPGVARQSPFPLQLKRLYEFTCVGPAGGADSKDTPSLCHF